MVSIDSSLFILKGLTASATCGLEPQVRNTLVLPEFHEARAVASRSSALQCQVKNWITKCHEHVHVGADAYGVDSLSSPQCHQMAMDLPCASKERATRQHRH